jgi:YD repeat-containing protein
MLRPDRLEPGALLASVDGPFSSDTITFTYDDFRRVSARTVNGSAKTMSTFDARCVAMIRASKPLHVLTRPRSGRNVCSL